MNLGYSDVKFRILYNNKFHQDPIESFTGNAAFTALDSSWGTRGNFATSSSSGMVELWDINRYFDSCNHESKISSHFTNLSK